VTFYQLVRVHGVDGLVYVMRPYITIYSNMVEVERYVQ